jgi:O-antigen/teichoic acid export membrane protein
MLFFFLTQGDKAFVGKVAGATMLGFYNIAYRISFVPASEIAHVIAGVTVPAYSKLQDSIVKIRQGYLRVLHATGFTAVPLGGLLFIHAPDIVRIFLGQKWMPAAPVMQALAIWGATRALTVTNDAVFIAVGRPRKLTKYMLFQLCVLMVLIYPFTSRWGILGTSVAVVLAGLTSSCLFFNGVRGIAGVRSAELARFIGIPLAAAVVAAVATALLRLVLPVAETVVARFIGSLVTYGFIYLALTVLLGRRLGYDVRLLAREIRSGLKGRPTDTPQGEPG